LDHHACHAGASHLPLAALVSGLRSFSDTAPRDIYTLSLHEALPIFERRHGRDAAVRMRRAMIDTVDEVGRVTEDEGIDCDYVKRSEEHTSESSHVKISYAVFCLKKKTPELQSDCPI